MALTIKKISSSTLIESLVSAVIISIVIGLAMVIFINLSSAKSSSSASFTAQMLANKIFWQVEKGEMHPEYWQEAGFEVQIQRKILDNDLQHVSILISSNDGSRPFYERSKVFYLPQ